MVTIEDILGEVPVCSRTVRNWVRAGLLPRPQRKGMGYRRGVVGLYPDATVEMARLIYEVRGLSKNGEMLRLIEEDKNKRIYIGVDKDGFRFLRYSPKSFWDRKENHDQD